MILIIKYIIAPRNVIEYGVEVDGEDCDYRYDTLAEAADWINATFPGEDYELETRSV